VIECGTFSAVPMHAVLRDDHWLHLHGDPRDALGGRIKHALFDAFLSADPDWREIASVRTRQVLNRASSGLPDIRPSREDCAVRAA
jgi:hypothetical protein